MNIKSFEQTPVSLWEVNRRNVGRLKDILRDCHTSLDAAAFIYGEKYAKRRLEAINKIVEEALKTI